MSRFLDTLLIGPDQAIFSSDQRYRYMLTRNLGFSGEGSITWIMLNPSTATAEANDPTITRCIDFSKRGGYKWMVVVNLYAYRATKPSEIWRVDDPVGRENNYYLQEAVRLSEQTVIAWGATVKVQDRAREVLEMLRWYDLYHLGLTQQGCPRHPLYVAKNQELQKWEAA